MAKVVIVPGNGGGDVRQAIWYGWLDQELRSRGCATALQNMPDPVRARESVWIPFMCDKLNVDSQTIIVGHSSGAEAGMRFCERWKVAGLVLVSACITDLGDENERASGYYGRPWEWNKIKSNAGWIAQFGSPSDPYIPIDEMRTIAKELQSEYSEIEDRGHFCDDEFPELLDLLLTKLQIQQ